MFSLIVGYQLIHTHTYCQRSTQSNKIEGTQTNIEDVFMPEEEFSGEKRNDWLEVQNYISAINEAVNQLHRLPFSSRLIKQTHKTLLQGVRGKHKQPGEYRNSQNWIGGASLAMPYSFRRHIPKSTT